MSVPETLVLGAGFCGLGAALASGARVLEAADHAGGVCHSYHLADGGAPVDRAGPRAADAFRFEPAGGHWMFGAGEATLRRLSRYGRFVPVRRKAAVFMPDSIGWVPYPLQEHLHALPAAWRRRALQEIEQPQPLRGGEPLTFKDWLLHRFGATLCDLFFFPFNRRYTAGLYDRIAPQDAYKTPLNRERVRLGAEQELSAAGYNPNFHHAINGLDRLVGGMAKECRIEFGQRVTSIDTGARLIRLESGRVLPYGHLVSTLPLDKMQALCGLSSEPEPDPATAVLVVNIAALKGPACPEQHWVYLPNARSAMHRVGFYSHVDAGYLPRQRRRRNDTVSLYVECAFLTSMRPSDAQRTSIVAEVVDELRAWGFIGEPLVIDSTWTSPAYTWTLPGSTWRSNTIHRLASHGIRTLGRYGGWHFQGMAESFEQGLAALATPVPPLHRRRRRIH